jgi:shikimate dehydrogenase
MRERLMGAAHLACIIGYPVAQSLSPAIHTAGFDALGLDWTYIAIAVQPGAAQDGIVLLRELGVEGASVTMPHKQDVVAYLDGLTGDAEVVGAVNTIAREGRRLIGHNTDGTGFVRFLRTDASFEPSGSRVVLLGAGGAARGVAHALAREGADVTVMARHRRRHRGCGLG